MSDQPPWDTWQVQTQGQPQYPPQQQYGQLSYGQPAYPQGQPYGRPGPGQYQEQPPYQGQPYGPPGAQLPYPRSGYGPQPPGPRPLRRRRKRHPVRNILAGIGAVVVAVTIAVLAIRDTSSHGSSASTFNAHAATIKACNDVLAFQNGNATDNFAHDPASAKALYDADDTLLETDLQAWVDDLQDGVPIQQTETEGDKVGADCGAVGIKLFSP